MDLHSQLIRIDSRSFRQFQFHIIRRAATGIRHFLRIPYKFELSMITTHEFFQKHSLGSEIFNTRLKQLDEVDQQFAEML